MGQQELAKRAQDLAAKTAAKPLSKFKKGLDPHMWVLSKDSMGSFLVTIGDPNRPGSTIKARFTDPSELKQWVKYDMARLVSADHVIDLTGMRLVPEYYSQSYIDMLQADLAKGNTRGIPPALRGKLAAQDPMDLAADILKEGTSHPAFKALGKDWDGIVQALGDAKRAAEGYARAGAGGTVEVDIFEKQVLPALEEYKGTFEAVLRQLKQRLEIR